MRSGIHDVKPEYFVLLVAILIALGMCGAALWFGKRQ
jgi:hypothetical protein